jgi:hypothetical protein
LWRYFFAVVVGRNPPGDGAGAADAAATYEEAWRYLEAAAEPAVRAGGPAWARNIVDARRLLEPAAQKALEKAVDAAPMDRAAWKWRLALAELYGPAADKAAKVRELARKAEQDMPPDAPEDYRRRVTKLLKAAG